MSSSIFISLLVIITLAVTLFLVIKKLTPKSTKQEESQDTKPTSTSPAPNPTEDAELLKLYNNLVSLNILSSLSNMPKESRDQVNTIINLLYDVLEPLNKNYPSESLTFKVNKITTSHLKDLIITFKQATFTTETDKDEACSNLNKQLTTLLDAVKRAQTALNSDSQQEFDKTVQFIDQIHS